MSSSFRRLFVRYGDTTVNWLKRASPPSLRRFLRRLLGRRGVAAIGYLARHNALASMRQHEQAMAAADPALMDEYSRLISSNAADLLLDVLTKFYSEIGVDPNTIPLLQRLKRFRSDLSDQWAKGPELETSWVLIRFERAWRRYRQQPTEPLLETFEAIFRDTEARKTASRDPFVKEAVVRSGEILGRYWDIRGHVEKAISVYREILVIDADGVVGRRLAVLLARRGDLDEAATLAKSVILSRPNLFPYLHTNPYIVELKVELSRGSIDSSTCLVADGDDPGV
jgi:tetratricopeptide (TPR) repeat protein